MAFINIGQVVYPVGSIYISTDPTSPSSLFGGVWEKIEDERFWLTVPLSKTAGQTGGEATHKLTVEEIPKHSHSNYPDGSTEYWAYGQDWGKGNAWSCGSSKQYTMARINWGSTGGDQPHNNMPPYRTCYSWIRTS